MRDPELLAALVESEKAKWNMRMEVIWTLR